LANAEVLASRFGAEALALADLTRHLAEADIVICSTASREPVLGREAVAAALRTRRHKPMLLIDLAVPRDVDPAVAELDDVFLYTVDDMSAVIADSLRSRQAAAREAEAIVELQVEHFLSWWQALEGHGPLKDMRASGERERDALLARALDQLGKGADPGEQVTWLAHTLTNKLLHTPSANLRAAALRGDAELLRAAQRLFAPGESPGRKSDDDA
jgi:glutamyl-tRNA reductase